MLKKFLSDENGATAIEYALIALLISIGIISGATALGGAISDSYTSTAKELDAAGG
ncbi:Flp family type IVb pilin [Nitratireductor luteus]|uniref:Flp family type IVb pilin n=1 Tax=Nitratireductor luteus TaxID=2976980 RepID=UPI0022402CDD|nr:Flp family type IVb pilin [Nitratireductor luteus]